MEVTPEDVVETVTETKEELPEGYAELEAVKFIVDSAYAMYKDSEGKLTLSQARDKAVKGYLGKKSEDLFTVEEGEAPIDTEMPTTKLDIADRKQFNAAITEWLMALRRAETYGPTSKEAIGAAKAAAKSIVDTAKEGKKQLLLAKKDTWKRNWNNVAGSISVKLDGGYFLTSQGVRSKPLGKVVSPEMVRTDSQWSKVISDYVGQESFNGFKDKDVWSAVDFTGINADSLTDITKAVIASLDGVEEVVSKAKERSRAKNKLNKAKQLDLFADVTEDVEVKTESTKESKYTEEPKTDTQKEAEESSQKEEAVKEDTAPIEKKPAVKPKAVKKTAVQQEAELLRQKAEANKKAVKARNKASRKLEGNIPYLVGKVAGDSAELLQEFIDKGDTKAVVGVVSRIAVVKAFIAIVANDTLLSSTKSLLLGTVQELEGMTKKTFMSGKEVKEIVGTLKDRVEVLKKYDRTEKLTKAIDDIIDVINELGNCK